MDITKLKRDDQYIKHLITDKKTSFIAKKNLSILFPSRFIDKGLSVISNEIKIFGVFIIFDDTMKYAIVNNPVSLLTEPVTISDVTIDDKDYKLLTYISGSKIISDTRIIPDPGDSFTLLDDWIVRSGNIPFYLGYEDIMNVFIRSSSLTGTPIGRNPQAIGALISIIGRDKTNEFIRVNHSKKEIGKMRIDYVGFNNVARAYKNTISMITGNYLDQGMTAALNTENPSKTDIEDIYRG